MYLLYFWKEYGKSEDATEYAKAQLEKHPSTVAQLLRSYAPHTFSRYGVRQFELMESGYKGATSVVPKEVIAAAISSTFSPSKVNGLSYKTDSLTEDESLANQFLFLARRAEDAIEQARTEPE
jgi:hypothetical protein